jgi:hypothetical protein
MGPALSTREMPDTRDKGFMVRRREGPAVGGGEGSMVSGDGQPGRGQGASRPVPGMGTAGGQRMVSPMVAPYMVAMTSSTRKAGRTMSPMAVTQTPALVVSARLRQMGRS